MRTRITPALAGCAALLLVLLAPSAVGSSAAVAEGSLTAAFIRCRGPISICQPRK